MQNANNNEQQTEGTVANIAIRQEPFYSLFANNEQRALEWSAVLDSQNISYELQKIDDGEGMLFLLTEKHFHAAMSNIDAYESERPFFERFQELFYPSSQQNPIRLKKGISTIFIAFLLTLFYFFIGAASEKTLWHKQGMLSAKFFTNDEWWSPLTALTLHADFHHLAGNMLFFIIFGTAAALQAGAGTSLLFILASGVLGNLTTLYFFGDRVYNSLGFSTAVFGVLGILATLRLMQNVRTSKISSFTFWLPLIAAIAIFGLTGGSGGSDLSGHLFGFLWGGILGVPLFFIAKWKKNLTLQITIYLLSLMIVTTAWYFAIKT